MDLWELAGRNADVLRFSTLFTARQVPTYLAEDEGVDRAIEWCKARGITRAYFESFRNDDWAPKELLARARDRFAAAGIDPRGCITPAGFGKTSTGWHAFCCFTNAETRRVMNEMSRHAAEVFDVVMIDDFFCCDCTCEECRAARGARRWADYKRELMLEVARRDVIEAGRQANPDVQFIIKYPAWHEMYQERGYDVEAESALFPMTWAGTETRGLDEPDEEARFPGQAQYRAYWLMRWLLGIGAGKCGGGWYDTIDTGPLHYVEQGRQTVLGGAPEAFLFNFGACYEGAGYDRGRGPHDMAALVAEMPEHFALARLIHGKEPRGLLGWKPPNSPPGPDMELHGVLGMAGLPMTAAHEFDADAPGFLFGYHVFHDPTWWDAVETALVSQRPIVATPAFLRTARPWAEGNRLALDELARRAVLLPDKAERDRWPELEALPAGEWDEMRNRAMEGIGRFEGPLDVSLHLFGEDVAVLESFRNEPATCRLSLEGWGGFEPTLTIPADAPAEVAAGKRADLTLPPRCLLALRRTD